MLAEFKIGCTLFLGFLLIQNLGLSADYFVDRTGTDSGAGSDADPFSTIGKAAEVAQGGDAVWIAPGVYRETVRPSISGEKENPIVFRSLEPDNPAVINGADVVKGPWQQVGDSNVYMADWVGDYHSVNMQSDQVFLDGKMYDLLRWPKEINDDLSDPNFGVIDDIVEYTYGASGGLISALPMTIKETSFDEPQGRWDGARVYVNISPPHKGDGQGQTGYVLATDTSTQTITWEGIDDRSKNLAAAHDNNWNVLPGNYYYLFDPTPEGLEATGGPEAALGEREWWLNRKTRKLYVRFPSGSSPSNHTVEAKRRDWGFDLSERSYITVRDIDLFATSVTTDPDPTDAEPELSPSTGVILDGLRVWYTTHFTNMDVELDYQGSWSGQSGVILNGSHHVVRNCEFYWSGASHLSVTGAEHRIYNNLFQDFNYHITEVGGINMSKDRTDTLSIDHKIGYNTLRSSLGNGIFFKPAHNSDRNRPGMYRLHNNLIYDIVRKVTDCGLMSTVGADLMGARVDHNVIHGGVGYIQSGIQIDYGGGFHIDHNVVYNTWAPINGSFSDMVIHNNVAISAVIWDYTPIGINYGARTAENSFLYNNIVRGDLSKYSETSAILEANIGGISSQLYPLFKYAENQNFTEHDYSLVSSATQAIDQGVVVPGFDDPISGTAPDIGAYEYGREPWKAGYDQIPWYFDDDDSLRFAAQGTTINGRAVLHPFSVDAPVTDLVVVETSPGVSVVLGSSTVYPDEQLEVQYTVDLSAPAPSTGWFILEGTQGGATHQQDFTFRISRAQTLSRIDWIDGWDSPLTFFPYETVDFSVQLFDQNGHLMVEIPDLQWNVTGGGSITPNGTLQTFIDQGGPYSLSVSYGDVEKHLEYMVQANWALHQPIEASSEKHSGTTASNANNGDAGTAWVSGASDDEWLMIDMGEYVSITQVNILWHSSLYGKRYQLEGSMDGVTWESFSYEELSEGGLAVHDDWINAKTARYFRLKILERARQTGYGIYDISILGQSVTDIMGASLDEVPGWRWSGDFGWFYDDFPGQYAHWVYLGSLGWNYIAGPGLYYKIDNFWAYEHNSGSWWYYTAKNAGFRFVFPSGWNQLNFNKDIFKIK